jgi:hypothetical protein
MAVGKRFRLLFAGFVRSSRTEPGQLVHQLYKHSDELFCVSVITPAFRHCSTGVVPALIPAIRKVHWTIFYFRSFVSLLSWSRGAGHLAQTLQSSEIKCSCRKARSRKNAQKNLALGRPADNDLNFLDIFYPRFWYVSGETGLFQHPQVFLCRECYVLGSDKHNESVAKLARGSILDTHCGTATTLLLSSNDTSFELSVNAGLRPKITISCTLIQRGRRSNQLDVTSATCLVEVDDCPVYVQILLSVPASFASIARKKRDSCRYTSPSERSASVEPLCTDGCSANRSIG